MDHTEAVRLQAVEKYVLGELSPFLRAQFEEHYFACADCALNLRAGVAFAAASRQFFAESPSHEAARVAPRRTWFGSWRPMVLVPTFAALLLFVGYQNLVLIPSLRHSGADANAEARPWFSLVDSSVHGSPGSRVEVERGQAFDLLFDITAAPRDPSTVFVATVKNANGQVVTTLRVPARRAQKSVIISLPADLQEGDYKVVIADQVDGSSVPAGDLPFTIAFSSQIQQH